MLIPTRLDKNSLYVTASVRFAAALSIFPRYWHLFNHESTAATRLRIRWLDLETLFPLTPPSVRVCKSVHVLIDVLETKNSDIANKIELLNIIVTLEKRSFDLLVF